MIHSNTATFTAIKLAITGPSVLACGAFLKNTICLTQGDIAYLSPVTGDLSTAEARHKLDDTVALMCRALSITPEIVAHDLHPDFYSTEFACSFAAHRQIPVLAVQHHHAHIAAVCAEYQLTEPVLGLALDGVGFGTDQAPWGGELLYVDGGYFERLGHLSTLALPGGDRAAQEPWRMAAAALAKLGRVDEIAQRFADQPAVQSVVYMLRQNINCPQTSSMGRLFDAAAGLLGVNLIQSHEAQAAMNLQRLAEKKGQTDILEQGYLITDNNQLDFSPLLSALMDDFNTIDDIERAAAMFHATICVGLAEWVVRMSQRRGVICLALGGGCFHNEILAHGLAGQLSDSRVRLFKAWKVPPDDSAIALGQAWVAMQAYRMMN